MSNGKRCSKSAMYICTYVHNKTLHLPPDRMSELWSFQLLLAHRRPSLQPGLAYSASIKFSGTFSRRGHGIDFIFLTSTLLSSRPMSSHPIFHLSSLKCRGGLSLYCHLRLHQYVVNDETAWQKQSNQILANRSCYF